MKREFLLMKLVVTALLAANVLLLASCSSKKDSGATADELAGGAGLSEADLNAQREGRYGSGAIPLAEGEGMFRDIHFAFDSTAIDDVARQNVEHNVQVLQSNPTLRVQLEGHCDERGTAEYNLALGSKRVQAVHDTLVSYGIPASRLETISYGEEVPLEAGQNEAAWARNRRVHFSAYAEQRR